MSAIVMSESTFTSGVTRENLRRAHWSEVIALKGIQLAAVAKDLDQYDIRPQVRLNPRVLAQFKPGATSLDPQLGEAWDYVIDEHWQSVRADFAVSLYYRSKEDPTLGGPTVLMETLDDGLGGKVWNPRGFNGYPDLFEFRMPAEAQPLVTKETK